MSRTALVTGVSGGIGKATAKIFMAAGWSVVGIDLHEDQKPQELDEFYRADVGNEDEVGRAFSKISARHNRMDALINNAATQITKPLVETTLEEWDSIMATNLRATYLMVRNAHPLMKQHGGAIVNISSVHAIATSSNISAYAATKGAILSLTRALAIELAPDHIRVNTVLPGAIHTPMLESGLSRGHLKSGSSQDQIQELGRRTAMGRVGRPEEVAQAILFLSDEERSSFITGEALVVDGGATVKLSTE